MAFFIERGQKDYANSIKCRIWGNKRALRGCKKKKEIVNRIDISTVCFVLLYIWLQHKFVSFSLGTKKAFKNQRLRHFSVYRKGASSVQIGDKKRTVMVSELYRLEK